MSPVMGCDVEPGGLSKYIRKCTDATCSHLSPVIRDMMMNWDCSVDVAGSYLSPRRKARGDDKSRRSPTACDEVTCGKKTVKTDKTILDTVNHLVYTICSFYGRCA